MHAKSQWRWSGQFRRLSGFNHGGDAGFPDVIGAWAARADPEVAQPTFQPFVA